MNTDKIINLVDFKRDEDGNLEDQIYNVEYESERYLVKVFNGYIDIFLNGICLTTL